MVHSLKIILFSFLFTQTLNAQNLFESLRKDQLIPKKCQQVSLSDFSDDIFYFTVGIRGAKKHGFDYEHPIDRNTVTRLWKKALGSKAWNYNPAHSDSPNQDYYQTIISHAPLMDFDLSSEGEILELLGALMLYDDFPSDNPENMFITGSVAYHDDQSSKIIGELDFIVADKNTCNIYAVGEAKLGTKKLGYAKQQLQRFKGFLANHKRKMKLLPTPEIFGF
ncbi:MAG: hypothetical protein H6625_00875 [Bdellovibrionaceae bacterium]|nr:hypothetical protein [Pseudobdellovibrionaceae bacterium]